MAPRVIIIGLDSVPPYLAFDTYRDCMPCLCALRQKGVSGPLRSTDPPITIPAWVSMTSGRTPGELGIYGFRQMPATGRDLRLSQAADVVYPRLWDTVCKVGLTSVVVSVPLTYPPAVHPRLFMTSDFLTPDLNCPWASSPDLQSELKSRFGPYIIDIDNFRSGEREDIAEAVHAFTRQHFAVFRHLIATRHPDFAMIVDLGPDRFHHALLSTMHGDPGDPGGRYYASLDAEIQQTIALAGPDTVVMVVSDHGVKPLAGVFHINEFLLETGHLVLKTTPTHPTPFSRLDVDWEKTRAWGEGGYHGRVFLNTTARSPQSRLRFEDTGRTLNELKRLFDDVRFADGRRMDNRVFTAAELYGESVAGHPPDLTVYFDDLNLRSNATVGTGSIFGQGNDTGVDDANHASCGIYVIARPGAAAQSSAQTLGEVPIVDVFSIALDAMGIAGPR